MIMNKEFLLEGPGELDTRMNEILELIGWRRKIALYGELGAGKTTFVKAFCRYFGINENTSSPTFSIINRYSYPASETKYNYIYHLDLYRLRTLAEAQDIGVEDVLESPDWCLIEWPQLIEPLFERSFVKIQLEILGKTSRRMLILYE